ncbi:hypothetical protein EG329_010309 [Mollisiaceae sp. DMI_Dod_QoI]|nr:hypothetical protein EG329_010309 [Helotiales sp. DMI_Dod_QoI]
MPGVRECPLSFLSPRTNSAIYIATQSVIRHQAARPKQWVEDHTTSQRAFRGQSRRFEIAYTGKMLTAEQLKAKFKKLLSKKSKKTEEKRTEAKPSETTTNGTAPTETAPAAEPAAVAAPTETKAAEPAAPVVEEGKPPAEPVAEPAKTETAPAAIESTPAPVVEEAKKEEPAAVPAPVAAA